MAVHEMTRTLITIDWDFFVPEDPMWDFGHRESLLFLNIIWSSRMGLFEEIKTDGNEIGFWDWLQERISLWVESLYVSESHLFAYKVATSEAVDRIILFDAHHDAWAIDNENQVACHNWVRVWMKHHPQGEVIWVHPDNEYQVDCLLPKDMEAKIVKMPYGDGIQLPEVEDCVVHICRSGCWTPPWLDEAFALFLAGAEVRFGEEATLLQDDEWNPVVSRWTSDELAAHIQNWEKMTEQLASLRKK